MVAAESPYLYLSQVYPRSRCRDIFIDQSALGINSASVWPDHPPWHGELSSQIKIAFFWASTWSPRSVEGRIWEKASDTATLPCTEGAITFLGNVIPSCHYIEFFPIARQHDFILDLTKFHPERTASLSSWQFPTKKHCKEGKNMTEHKGKLPAKILGPSLPAEIS